MKTAHIIKRCEWGAGEHRMGRTRLCLIRGLTQRMDYDSLFIFLYSRQKKKYVNWECNSALTIMWITRKIQKKWGGTKHVRALLQNVHYTARASRSAFEKEKIEPSIRCCNDFQYTFMMCIKFTRVQCSVLTRFAAHYTVHPFRC